MRSMQEQMWFWEKIDASKQKDQRFLLSEWLLVNSDVFKVFLICISAHVSEFRLCGPNLILLLFFWRLVQYWFESLCFDFRCSVHAPVLGLTCKPIPLSYCAHPRPICLLVSRLPGSHLKSFGYVNPARLSLICKSRLKWYGGSVDLMQSNTSIFVSLRITKVGLCSLCVERIRRRTCVVDISWADPWFAALEVISVWSLYLSLIVLSQIFIHLICICPAPQLSPSRDQEQGASKVFLEILG